MSDDEIVRVAARGEGMTEAGRAVPLAAPGDRLTPTGDVLPGPHHLTPPCKHYPRCGGCQLQHLDDSAYARYLVERIEGALAAQGLETDIRPPPLSPDRSRRRAVLHAERRGRQVWIGFTEARSHALVDMEQCWVIAPDLFDLVQPLRGLLAAILPGSRRANLTLTRTDQGLDVLIEGIEADGLAAAEGLTAFAQRHNLARLAIDSGYGPEARWEPEPVTITLGGVPVSFPPAAFLQATPEGEAALVAAVREAIGPATTTADLFAGLGTFALSIPGKVYAAEAARDASLGLKAAAARAQRPVFVEHRDLYRRPLTADELGRFEAVVLDPPRAGAREQATALAQSTAPKIAYVSCNPSTFARDAKELVEGGYTLDWIQPVGQFRWSTHVELAARLSRQG
ncbi:23S rRNA m(5)U-1939 methyltransferase [Hephaestia caeni]|uniref:23S rRNA m(5)U-1939 methyltransferase n=1 Tax=Hephaestia caeni TaxID=645617 RepID=A0A397P8J4_9SPHN|nr:class I SAM-dependent RNA methyltransferase [Hephaestia caeni]RIA45886.1 23S rRNA m(5)U-1939 methyltransferase [Hephaestia caeni]